MANGGEAWLTTRKMLQGRPKLSKDEGSLLGEEGGRDQKNQWQ